MSTSSSVLAGRLNALKTEISRFALGLNAERDGLPALMTLAGAGSTEHAKLTERRAQIKDANDALNEAIDLFNQARAALLTDNDEEKAEDLLKQARRRLADAQQLFGNNTPTTPPAPSPAPAPVPAPPAPDKDEDDKGAKPAPAVPTPPPAPEPGTDEEPAWAKRLIGTLEQHVKDSGEKHEKIREALLELGKGTIKPELAAILNDLTEEQLRAALATSNGGTGSIDPAEINRRFDEFGRQINADDLQFLRDLRVAMEHEELTLAELVIAMKMGRLGSGFIKGVDKRRWDRSRHNPGSHS